MRSSSLSRPINLALLLACLVFLTSHHQCQVFLVAAQDSEEGASAEEEEAVPVEDVVVEVDTKDEAVPPVEPEENVETEGATAEESEPVQDLGEIAEPFDPEAPVKEFAAIHQQPGIVALNDENTGW